MKLPWNGYMEMRKKIRKPITDSPITLAINTLDKLRNEGQSPAAILDQSTLNSWQGLFSIQERHSEHRPGQRASFP